jgi:hypothetical protein
MAEINYARMNASVVDTEYMGYACIHTRIKYLYFVSFGARGGAVG